MKKVILELDPTEAHIVRQSLAHSELRLMKSKRQDLAALAMERVAVARLREKVIDTCFPKGESNGSA